MKGHNAVMRLMFVVLAILIFGLSIYSREPLKMVLGALYLILVMCLFFPKDQVIGQILQKKDNLVTDLLHSNINKRKK